MIPSRIAFVRPMCSPKVSSSMRIRRRPVALEHLLDLVQHVRRRAVARLEPRVVRAEHALERAAAVGDQRQRLDGPEEVPGGERQRVVVLGRRARRQRPTRSRRPRRETSPGIADGIGVALERVGQLTHEVLALADARVVEASPSSSACLPTALTCAPPTTIGTSARSLLDPPRRSRRHAGTRRSCT